jgi:hypothetical protein
LGPTRVVPAAPNGWHSNSEMKPQKIQQKKTESETINKKLKAETNKQN